MNTAAKTAAISAARTDIFRLLGEPDPRAGSELETILARVYAAGDADNEAETLQPDEIAHLAAYRAAKTGLAKVRRRK